MQTEARVHKELKRDQMTLDPTLTSRSLGALPWRLIANAESKSLRMGKTPQKYFFATLAELV